MTEHMMNHKIYDHLLQVSGTSVNVRKCDMTQYTHPGRAANHIQHKHNNDVLDTVTYHLQKKAKHCHAH